MNKLALGIVVGLVVGIIANPLMPPAFFVVGGVLLWYVLKSPPGPPSQPEGQG